MTKIEEEFLLIMALENSPKLRVIDFFLDNKLFDFSKKGNHRRSGTEQDNLP